MPVDSCNVFHTFTPTKFIFDVNARLYKEKILSPTQIRQKKYFIEIFEEGHHYRIATT